MTSIQPLFRTSYAPLAQLKTHRPSAFHTADKPPKDHLQLSASKGAIPASLVALPKAPQSLKAAVQQMQQPRAPKSFSLSEIQALKALQPPAKNAPPTAENTQKLKVWLNARLAEQPLADHSYTFYEAIEQYLGPWGESAYPLGYGKRYNQAFMAHPRFQGHPVTQTWVHNTGLRLQLLLRDLILERFEAGTLGSLTEQELTQFAFDSHPQAYIQAGLGQVLWHDFGAVPHIVGVPGEQFLPTASHFGASVGQVFRTATQVVPQWFKERLTGAELLKVSPTWADLMAS